VADVVPIMKLPTKCGWRSPPEIPPFTAADSPASSPRPGEYVWSAKLPLVTASEIRNACPTKPYPAAAG
jgi:hypothetical protein